MSPTAPAITAELLIDPREREGFRRLVAALNAGRVDTTSLAVDDGPAPTPFAPLDDLSIPPLPAIEPIDAGGD